MWASFPVGCWVACATGRVVAASQAMPSLSLSRGGRYPGEPFGMFVTP